MQERDGNNAAMARRIPHASRPYRREGLGDRATDGASITTRSPKPLYRVSLVYVDVRASWVMRMTSVRRTGGPVRQRPQVVGVEDDQRVPGIVDRSGCRDPEVMDRLTVERFGAEIGEVVNVQRPSDLPKGNFDRGRRGRSIRRLPGPFVRFDVQHVADGHDVPAGDDTCDGRVGLKIEVLIVDDAGLRRLDRGGGSGVGSDDRCRPHVEPRPVRHLTHSEDDERDELPTAGH